MQNHVSNIRSKLQVPDRAQAIVRAREAGLGRRQRTQLPGSLPSAYGLRPTADAPRPTAHNTKGEPWNDG